MKRGIDYIAVGMSTIINEEGRIFLARRGLTNWIEKPKSLNVEKEVSKRTNDEHVQQWTWTCQPCFKPDTPYR